MTEIPKSLRDEIQNHTEKTWVLCLTDDLNDEPLKGLSGITDFYNNGLLTRSILSGKIKLTAGEKTLMAISGGLPAEKLVIFGLGKGEKLLTEKARELAQDLSQMLNSMNEKNPWIIVQDTPTTEKFANEIKKHATISKG